VEINSRTRKISAANSSALRTPIKITPERKTNDKTGITLTVNYRNNGRLIEEKMNLFSNKKDKGKGEFKSTLTIDVIKENVRNVRIIDSKLRKIRAGRGGINISKIEPQLLHKIVNGRVGDVSENINIIEDINKSEYKSENIMNARNGKTVNIVDERIVKNTKKAKEGTCSTSSASSSTFSVSHISPCITTTSYIAFAPPHAHKLSNSLAQSDIKSQTKTQMHSQIQKQSDNLPGIEVLYGKREEGFESESDCEGQVDKGNSDREGVVGGGEGVEGERAEGGDEKEERSGVKGKEGEKGDEVGGGKRGECHGNSFADIHTDMHSERETETEEREGRGNKENEEIDIGKTQEGVQAEETQGGVTVVGEVQTGDTSGMEMDDDMDGECEKEVWKDKEEERENVPDDGIEESSIEDVDVIEDFFDVNTVVKGGSVGKGKGKEDELSSFFVSTFSPSNSAYHIDHK
jgi:hypothetical protein